MIKNRKYVFIIGAGASIPYGFPSGQDLYDLVKDKIVGYAKQYARVILESTQLNPIGVLDQAKKFAQALKNTNGVSVDKFININPEFDRIGRLAIAAAILQCENESIVPISSNVKEDNWYGYLYGKLIEGLDTAHELLQFGDNNISFITFNYDRSLEHYLSENLFGLLANSNVNKPNIVESLKRLKIIHVYGQTGFLPYQVSGGENDHLVMNYGSNKDSLIENANKILPLMEVMYSSRENSNAIIEAKNLLSQADRILFLGFGYDTLNLKILGFPLKYGPKDIMGTAYEKTSNERIHLQNKIITGLPGDRQILFDYTSTYLLRQFLV
jgi:hypothetical protein